MRAADDAGVCELRVQFERALAEKRRRVALSAQESAMCLLVRYHLFFLLEYQLALLARKFRLASLNVRVVLHFRRQREAAIFARRRDRRPSVYCHRVWMRRGNAKEPTINERERESLLFIVDRDRFRRLANALLNPRPGRRSLAARVPNRGRGGAM